MNLTRFRFICAATIIFSALVSSSGQSVHASERKISVTRVTLRTSGGDIGAEVFEAADQQKHPAILVLHGAGGMIFDGPAMRRVARSLAEDGNAAYVVDYFESTGTLFARIAVMEKNFETWLATVRDSIAAVQKIRGDPSPVGIYGYSLGGFLSLIAASDNPRVAAVIEHAGGAWNGRMDCIGKLPAVLMIHGEADTRVPVAKYARPLIPVLRRRAASLETRFFPGEGHVFSQGAMNKVCLEAAKFFRKNLPHQRTR